MTNVIFGFSYNLHKEEYIYIYKGFIKNARAIILLLSSIGLLNLNGAVFDHRSKVTLLERGINFELSST